MNILLTNDDGYDSYGIRLLFEKIKKYGRVVIVAPEGAMSAKSVSLTLGRPVNFRKIEDDVFALDGTPADCVSFGLSMMNIAFDLVVSGCNNGLNISYDTMYSGTVGAALQALMFKIPAVAISTPANEFKVVENHFDEVFSLIIDKELYSIEYMLNVNFPYGGEAKGYEFGNLYYRYDDQFFTEQNDGYYAYRTLEKDIKDIHSDCYQVEHGIISIVPLSKTFYKEEILKELQEKVSHR